ncbi:MAG TPA: cupin domain-containing protein [Candidatus Acidoferrum sp.]|nr:cupin domain-containing protein [Candidatus Acidoferrum sp.]
MDWAKHGVKIVHSAELDLNTPQTSGMTRAAAITYAKAGASKLWAGTMVVQPDAKTGPHHHGELETVLYVVKGRVRMRWGDQLELKDEARPGDFIYVPPYVPHQEINASPNEICEAVVVRDGQDPIVVNLDVHTPEPASAEHRGMAFHPER